MQLYCSKCHEDVDVDTVGIAVCPKCGTSFDPTIDSVPKTTRSATINPEPPNQLQDRFGRYIVSEKLGEGSFGVVYRGTDEELRRDVAIKVPNPVHIATESDVQAFLAEARTLARLDHPHVVPVYDVGRTDDGLCYVVSKFIDGGDLKSLIAKGRMNPADAVNLILQAAEGLHHAHLRGLVHRDIKPGNILIDCERRAVVADFGLALRDEDYGKGPSFTGTPAYMSPEQARGEGHRVDARSDVYSLGVVLYEMLTGRRPFLGATIDEILDGVVHHEPRPPRQLDGAISRELDRIVLKCLAKRASDRYSTVADLVEDLRQWQIGPASASIPAMPAVGSTEGHGKRVVLAPDDSIRRIPIVPKGLLSFDAADSGFYLTLLPGPHDRDGLPDSVRFWKTRIEEFESEKTFSIGLLFGPSGCGKSSLVKAGLIPRLSGQVRAVYVEATGDETESRLLRQLNASLPQTASHSLVDVLSGIRRGQWLPRSQKLLIVLDQFEQWLHANRETTDSQMLQALRHADGVRLQVILLVRDDFSMAAARIFRELEIPIVEGQNFAIVDRFSIRHALRVLTLFGQAYGALPSGEPTGDQSRFLEQAVADLAVDGQVICVHLALFADMLKSKPWNLATLRDVGGVAGVGVAFLEESLGDRAGNPSRRMFGPSCRAVLSAMLPDAGMDIKRTHRDRQSLAAAAGLDLKPREFDDIIRILDNELHLITPADDAGAAGGYQLTHDYLVPALREWLTRKERETKHGRALLLLKERSDLYQCNPQDRFLPDVFEYLTLRRHTRPSEWSKSQSKLMRLAGRKLLFQSVSICILFLAVAGSAIYAYGNIRGRALARSIESAATPAVPALVAELAPFRHWAAPVLKHFVEQPTGSKELLNARLALLSFDARQIDPICAYVPAALPSELHVIAALLQPYSNEASPRLWAIINSPDSSREVRLRCAAALATLDPKSNEWPKHSKTIAIDLAQENALLATPMVDMLRPMRELLLPELSEQCRAPSLSDARTLATGIVADYASDQPELLTKMLLVGDLKQAVILAKPLEKHVAIARKLALAELELRVAYDASDDVKDATASRQAMAAALLLRMGESDAVWPLLIHSPSPRIRSWLIHRIAPFNVPAKRLIERFAVETDVSAQRAILLAIGEYPLDQIPTKQLNALATRLLSQYRTDPDPGLHSAIDWLLRQRFGRGKELDAIVSEFTRNAVQQRNQRESGTIQEPAPRSTSKHDWFVNTNGQTFSVIRGPVEFTIGSPTNEPDRDGRRYETPFPRVIPHSFGICDREVTVEQYLQFQPAFLFRTNNSPQPDRPINDVNWYHAAAYCRWLSEQDGVPEDEMCYPRVEAIKPGMKPIPGYLSKTGYRLPTEAEWEYAARAGALTSRHYGSTNELLDRYAWFLYNSNNRYWPVGRLKPNDFGLFDTLGNALEWCQEKVEFYENQPTRLTEDMSPLMNDSFRALRGGSFFHAYGLVRSARRERIQPNETQLTMGFRVVRTIR